MSDYRAEVITSRFDTWLDERVCRPSLEYVPRSVAPNTISLANAVVCWLMFAGAALAPGLSPLTRLVVLVFTGILVFASMVLDCWDGMQARRTGRTSKLGELLDHWLDAIHVPLTTGAMVLMLEMPPWLLVTSHVLTAMIYNAQLVVYHATGRFVHPPTSGAQGQFGVAWGFAVSGLLFFFLPRETAWIGWMVGGIGVVATVLQIKQCWFYYVMIPQQLIGHLPTVVYGFALGGLYLAGAMSSLWLVLAVVFVSFRLSGSYVLFTIVKKRFTGNDWGIAALIAAIAAVHFGGVPPLLAPQLAQVGLDGYPAAQAVTVVACAYMIARNLWDLSRHFAGLKPQPRVAAG